MDAFEILLTYKRRCFRGCALAFIEWLELVRQSNRISFDEMTIVEALNLYEGRPRDE